MYEGKMISDNAKWPWTNVSSIQDIKVSEAQRGCWKRISERDRNSKANSAVPLQRRPSQHYSPNSQQLCSSALVLAIFYNAKSSPCLHVYRKCSHLTSDLLCVWSERKFPWQKFKKRQNQLITSLKYNNIFFLWWLNQHNVPSCETAGNNDSRKIACKRNDGSYFQW